MKKNRLIFYGVFAAFHLFLVFFSIYVESNKNDLGFMIEMLKWMSFMKWGAIFGLALLVLDVIWVYRSAGQNAKENAAVNHELNTLKAKLFDLQESAKEAQRQNP